ncbi:MAG: ABC transporter permease subunit [Thermoanaerobacterium sp.]|nr:ABC transporter permease subunit [Thermoanaerobacterium sp.]
MNVFLYELRSKAKSLAVWSISLIFVAVFLLSMYPTFYKNASLFKDVLEGYPVAVRKAFGISMDDIIKFLGYYSYVFSYVVLLGAIQAMNYGVAAISKEVKLKTADFLMTKPIKRGSILTSKILSSLVILLITDAVYFLSAFIMAKSVAKEPFSIKLFFMISVTLLFVEIIFLSIGVLLSSVVRKVKSTTSLSLGVVFAFYIIGMIQAILNDDNMKYLTPFKYFDLSYIMKNSSYDIHFSIISLLIVVVSIALSYVFFQKRDIYAM